MTLYHGGAEEIANPDLSHSRKAVDFGAGFYVTPMTRCLTHLKRFSTALLQRSRP